MTDNCPKLFSIDVKAFSSKNKFKLHPEVLFSFGFGFTGSTLIGINVKEMLNTFVSSLNEVPYTDQPNYLFEDRFPSLDEISVLTKKIAEKYISQLGVIYPDKTGCEFVIFGFCMKNKEYEVIKLHNTYSNPTNIKIEKINVSKGKQLILGDKKSEIENIINKKRNKFKINSLNWWRSPLIALAKIIKEEDIITIGGYLQLCISNKIDTKLIYLSSGENNELEIKLVGFDLFKDIGMLGGFSVIPSIGILLPNEDGW